MKRRQLGPTPRFWYRGLGWSWRICISSKFLVDSEANGLGTADLGNEWKSGGSQPCTQNVQGKDQC